MIIYLPKLKNMQYINALINVWKNQHSIFLYGRFKQYQKVESRFNNKVGAASDNCSLRTLGQSSVIQS